MKSLKATAVHCSVASSGPTFSRNGNFQINDYCDVETGQKRNKTQQFNRFKCNSLSIIETLVRK